MSDNKQKKKPERKKKNITCHVNEKLLEEWREEVKLNGKFYSGAMEEAMRLWIAKYNV